MMVPLAVGYVGKREGEGSLSGYAPSQSDQPQKKH